MKDMAAGMNYRVVKKGVPDSIFNV